MKSVAPREGANAPRTRSFLKLYWFFCYAAVLFAVPLTDSMADPPPVGSLPDVQLYAGGSAKTINLYNHISDPSGTQLGFGVRSSQRSYVTASVSDSTLTLTPVAVGSSTITVKAYDALNTVYVSFTATVEANSAPTGSISNGQTTVGSNLTYALSNYFRDADGDTLTYSASSSNTSYVTVGVSGSTLTVTPVAVGSSTITVTANDGKTSTNVTFTVTVSASPNNAPPSDPPGGDDPPENLGDPPPPSNNPPVSSDISNVTLTVAGGNQTINLLSYFSDPDGDTLTFAEHSSDQSYVTSSVSGSTLTLTPVAAGSSLIGVWGDDGEFAAFESFTATVSAPPNNAPPSDPPGGDDPPESEDPPPPPPDNPPPPSSNPIARRGNPSNSPPQPVGSTQYVSLPVGASTSVQVSFSDPDGDTLSYSVSGGSGVASASLSGNTLTITALAAGSASIYVTATDPHGATAAQTVSVTVVSPLDNPETPDNPQSPDEGDNGAPQPAGSAQYISLPVGASESVQVSFSDPDGDTLSYSVSGGNNAASTSLSGNTVTITALAAGSATITVTAADPHGATAAQTISVTVVQPRTATITRLPRIPAKLLKVSGDNQSAEVHAALSDPLVVEVRDELERVVEDVTVRFDLAQSGAALDSTPITDANGQASAALTLGDNPGEFTVEASIAEIEETVIFTIAAVPMPLDIIHVDTLEFANSVNGVAFSPDGKTLASAHADNTVQLWDVESRQRKHRLTGHKHAVRSVAFSPDGKTVGSGSQDKTVRLWDADTGDLKQTISGHAGAVWSVAFSPDGNTLGCATERGYVDVWDIGNLKRIERKHRISAHEVRARSVAFSPDGLTLASGGGDNTVRLWNPDTGEQTATLDGHEEQVLSVAFGGSNTLASGSADNTVRIWNLETGAARKLDGHTDWVFGVAFHPNGEILASTGKDSSVRLWHVGTGTPLNTLERHANWVRGVAVSRDGILASAGYDDIIHLWDLGVKLVVSEDTEKTVRRRIDAAPLDVTHVDTLEFANSVPDVAFSPDGKTLASAHADNSVQLWDVESRQRKHRLTGHEHAVRAVAFSLDGKTVASGSQDRTVRLWDADTGDLKQTISAHAGAVWSVAFSPDGNTLASATERGYVDVWDIGNPRRIERKHRISAHEVRARSVAFSPDGLTLASAGGDNTIRLWNPETGEQTATLDGHEEQVLSVAFGGSNTLASGSADSAVRIWDLDTGTARTLDGHTDWVFGVAFHPNGEVLASTGKDNSVRLWHVETGMPLNTLKRHANWVRSAAVSRDGILASAGYDDVIHIWDLGVKSDDMQQTQSTGVAAAPQVQPATELLPNFPNPFNPETWIPYHLEAAADVSLSIYNVSGRLVRTLDLGYQSAGLYANRSDAIYWDGRNTHGEQVASGVYIYRLTAGDYSASRRMVIVK